MAKLEELARDIRLKGVVPNAIVTVVDVKWFGKEAVELTFKSEDGSLSNQILYRSDEANLEVFDSGRTWGFKGDGLHFRLASEAQRINLAYLFDPLLAVHTSVIDPLPHQITAVYEEMLPRQPLRFLLADDPGAGKTVMSGLLIKELITRGDLNRCLIVSPGSLAEQWQDELITKFQLKFDILTNDKVDAAISGNYFAENNYVIARLDKLSRSPELQAMLTSTELSWDLVIVDEAHKMSATYYGDEPKYTKRFRLGELLSGITRNLLLLTATPHSGKDQDFQLFLSLLDPDRFVGKNRDGVSRIDASDLMRRAIKEQLLKFDGTPLFPERIAHTVTYELSEMEAELYKEVTEYVRTEFNRAEALSNNKRAGTVGFALTILQRRLASSPEAIFQSLRRRRERLEKKIDEFIAAQKAQQSFEGVGTTKGFDLDDLEDLEDLPDAEFDEIQNQLIDEATAAGTIAELQIEIKKLQELEQLAVNVRKSGLDSKWRELLELLGEIYKSGAVQVGTIEKPSEKLVIFTEHKDTLNYLVERVSTYLGRSESVVAIHGSVPRHERTKIQERFTNDPDVKVLVATDAAGEGINLQRAHLMVNYDLPWNPNRLEQRFGRIHRIGQKDVCYLWNLVAGETREGDVYLLLLRKLDEARSALGGQVFDVLGKIDFGGRPLRDLLLDAIRYSERPEVKARLETVVSNALDIEHLRELIGDKALVTETMSAASVFRVKEEMERAEARRLQPGYIADFFLGALTLLGGRYFQREANRYEITFVPAQVRNATQKFSFRETVLTKYERIVFDKSLISHKGAPTAQFIAPGHPLLKAIINTVLEMHLHLLKEGTTLVDENDPGTAPRVLFYLNHTIRDGTRINDGSHQIISKRMLYVEMDSQLNAQHIAYAPYLDYRPLGSDDPSVDDILRRNECDWIGDDLEGLVMQYGIEKVVPTHLEEVRRYKLPLLQKTAEAVHERLTKEFNYWYFRADQLAEDEVKGKPNARLNSNEARKRADELVERRDRRLAHIALQKEIVPLPPVIFGAALIVPRGLLDVMKGSTESNQIATRPIADRQEIALRARKIVMERERRLGFEPVDREFEKLGYDIESRNPANSELRFIEVKGRVADSETITLTKNEIVTSINNPDKAILAVVEFLDDGNYRETYLKQPFQAKPDFFATSVNYSLAELIAYGVRDNP